MFASTFVVLKIVNNSQNMKKRLLMLYALVLWQALAWAQNPVCNFGLVLSSEQANVGDTVEIEVSVRNFTDILGLQYNHQWNPQQLGFVEVVLEPGSPLFPSNFNQSPALTAQGLLNFSWFDNSLLGLSLSDFDVLYTIRLEYLQAGPASITTNGTQVPVEVIDINNTLLEDYYLVHGQVGTDLSPADGSFPDFIWGCAEGQSCNDPTSGAIEIAATGSGGLSYVWAGPGGYTSTTANIDGLQPGAYSLTITNGNGRNIQGVFQVSQPEELLVELVMDGDECGGAADGQLQAMVSGGSGDYSFSWSNGATTAINSNLSSGSYSVTVTDNIGGCSVTAQSTVEDISLLWAGANLLATSCGGSADGSIDLYTDAPAGYQPLSFSWSNGALTEDLSDIPAGIYSVTITAANACVAVYSFELSSTSFELPEATVLPAGCEGEGLGSISIPLDGGDFSFSWSTGAVTSDVSDLLPGSYSVSVTDLVNGCVAEATYEVPGGDLITGVSYDCLAETNYELTRVNVVVWNNDDPPYTFNWSTGDETTGEIFSQIEVPTNGTYQVTITSAGGCSKVLDLDPSICVGGQGLSLRLDPGSQTAETGQTVCMDIVVDGFTAIAGFQYSLGWDPAQLSFASVNNISLAGMTPANFGYQLTGDGYLSVSWIAPDVETGVTHANNYPLYEVCWDVIGEGPGSVVSFGDFPTPREFTNADQNLLPVTTQSGSVLINGGSVAGSAGLSLGSTQASAGETACLSLQVEGFTDVAGFQFSLNWDPAALQYSSVELGEWGANESLNLGLSSEALQQGKLRLLWVDQDLSGLTLINGTELLEVCFNVIGDPGTYPVSISDDPVPVEIVSTQIEQYLVSTQGGTIQVESFTDDPASLRIADAAVEPGGSVCVPVLAENLVNILGMQFSIAWDADLITFDHVVPGDALPGLGATNFNAEPGQEFVSFAWVNSDLTGITLPQGEVLFELCFNAGTVEGSSGITFTNSPTEIEFIRDDEIIPFIPINGVLEVTAGGLVWPGDTDLNELVNHYDLLNIGLAFAAEGQPRNNPSIEWLPQFAAPWVESTPLSQVNFRHADTNGDGMVNAQDTMALALNWGQQVDGFAGGNGQTSSSVTEIGPPIYVQADTVEAGSTVTLPVILGTPDEPVAEAYGLAFSILYDAEMVTPGSVSLDLEGWLGDPSENLLTIYRDHPGLGKVDIAMVRTDGLNVGGQGTIGNMTITMEDVIFRTNIDVEVVLEVTGVQLITYAEVEVPTSPRQTITLVENVTSTEEPEALRVIQLAPNPTTDWVQVTSPGLEIERIDILNAMGQLQHSCGPTTTRLDLKDMPAGTYWLRIVTDEGTAHRSVIKQ